MMKLKLNGGKEVNLNLTIRGAMNYEKETGKHSFVKVILNTATKNLTSRNALTLFTALTKTAETFQSCSTMNLLILSEMI